MKLARFEIQNFKNLESVGFNWDDMAVLIGANNTGKSSVLQSLAVFLSGKQIKDKSLFRNEICNQANAINLTAHFADLNQHETEAIAVRGRMYQGQWILRKMFWLEADEDGDKWRECYYSYHEQEDFEEWPDNQRSWGNWPETYTPLIDEVKAEVGSNRVTNDAIEVLKEKVRQAVPQLVTTHTGWVENPGGGGNWKSNANSIVPELVFVQAVHEATAETQAKDVSTYGKIVNLLIERRLAQREEFRDLQQQIDRVKALFTPNPEHPEWQQAEEIRELEQAISEKLSEIIDARAKIETTELNIPSVILPATELKIDDGFLTAVTDQGHGLQRTLIISLLQVLNQYSREAREAGESPIPTRSVIFAIEEPEIYLHPQMIRKIKDVLSELSSDPSYQVICPTHSPILLDMAESHRSIVRFEKDSDRNITVKQVDDDIFSGPAAEEQRQQMRMIAEFDSSVNELFFADRVVLVEGDTEVAVFQAAADLMALFANPIQKHDTTFIDCRGKSSMVLFMQVLNHFKIPYIAVHDIDRAGDDTNQLIADTARDKATVLTFDPDIEHVLGYSASGKGKPIKALNKLRELHAQNTLPQAFIDNVRAAYGV